MDMVETPSSDEPPNFESVFRGQDVEQRVYGTILQARQPITASAIASRAECDPKTARKYLSWFTELGVVTRHGGRPETYERNDAYFEWRRTYRLATEHSVEELQERVRELTTRIARYEERYDASTPADVDAITLAETSEDRTIDDVYADLGDWATARQERRYYELARQQNASANSESVSG